jgi:hypothetical protein
MEQNDVNNLGQQQYGQQGWMPQKNLPNAIAVLILGICSIFPGCFCFGVVGIACGIVALVLSKKDMALYSANPNIYSISSYNNLKAGRICAIIGLCVSAMILIFYLVYFIILGAAITMIPWGNLK